MPCVTALRHLCLSRTNRCDGAGQEVHQNGLALRCGEIGVVQALPDGDAAERHQHGNEGLARRFINNRLADHRFQSAINHLEELIEFRNAITIIAGSDQPE